jgi:gamma-glutamylcyclotransferase (GGCT)/AIG2-like uncharacterized protein YtfP
MARQRQGPPLHGCPQYSDQPLRLHLGAGQLLASVDSTIVILKSQTLDFAPHAERHEEFPTVATSSANKVVGAEFHLSAGTLPDLDKLFSYVAEHPEASPGAVQTATLILTENLPLSAFAKFNELSAGAENIQESQDFKADTVDILSALTIIKDLGIDRPLAVTIDPQLEVEAMIDPAAHGLAQYYGINDEWAYWKNQLLQGDPSTRHYALYGIARFYPDVALQMLPKWARQESVSPFTGSPPSRPWPRRAKPRPSRSCASSSVNSAAPAIWAMPPTWPRITWTRSLPVPASGSPG